MKKTLFSRLADINIRLSEEKSQNFFQVKSSSLKFLEGLQQSLQQLQEQLPDPEQNRAMFQSWWQTNHLAWTEQLRTAIALHRNIQSRWHFSPEQQEVMQRCYDANQLLIDCLNSNCEVTVAVRREIEAALLLPQKELEEREWDK